MPAYRGDGANGNSYSAFPEERAKAEAERKASGTLANYPKLVDITASTGIHFEHLSSPEAKYIAESMSGGVALIDYDRDGWPDIYFTNGPERRHGATRRQSAVARSTTTITTAPLPMSPTKLVWDIPAGRWAHPSVTITMTAVPIF